MTSSEKRGGQFFTSVRLFFKVASFKYFLFLLSKRSGIFTNLFPNQDIGLEIHWRRRRCELRADNPRYDRRRLAVGVSIAR